MLDDIRVANLAMPGVHADANGDPEGDDPRRLTAEEFQTMGIVPKSFGRAIRAKCLQCCCGSPPEVRSCILVSCPLWPYRMGSNPFRKPRALSEEQRKRAAARFAKYRAT